MNDRQRQDDPELQDVFQEFLLLADTPDAGTLETMVARYPQFSAQLTDFAVEWAMQDLLPGGAVGDSIETLDGFATEPDASVDGGMSAAVTAAMDRLHAGLDEVPSAHRDPFKDRSPEDLHRLGRRLQLDKTLVAKLRDRRIEAETVPDSLRLGLAQELEVPLDAVVAHLQRPPVLSMGASFKAEGKPHAIGKESFGQAVERSRLEPEEKQSWLDALPDIGPDLGSDRD